MTYIVKVCFYIICALFISSLFVPIDSAAIVKRETQDEPMKICEKGRACGWASYQPFTNDITTYMRNITTYMRNACVCPQNEYCIRVKDISYQELLVFECHYLDPSKIPASMTTTEAPLRTTGALKTTIEASTAKQ